LHDTTGGLTNPTGRVKRIHDATAMMSMIFPFWKRSDILLQRGVAMYSTIGLDEDEEGDSKSLLLLLKE
jgi:hypothetical protein